MLSRIKRWLSSPVFEGDEEKTFRSGMLNTILLVIIGMLLIIMPAGFLGGITPASTLYIDLFILGTCLFLRYLLKRGKDRLVGLAIMVLGFLFVPALVASLGTVRTPTTSFYLLLVIISGIIFGWPGLVVALLAASSSVLGLILAENAGVLPAPDYSVNFTQWITFTALFGLTGGLVYVVYRSTQEALSRSKSDLGERQRAEDASRKLLQAVNQSPVSIVITDLEGTIEYVNPRFTQVTGYTLNEAVGKNPRILRTDLTPADTHRQLWNTLKAGKEWRGEFINRKKDGKYYAESALVAPIFDENGTATHYLAIKEDITERKQIEEELRASEARYRALFDQVHDGVFILGLDGKHLMANQRAAEILGYSVEELLQLSVKDTSAEIDSSMNILQRLHSGEHVPIYERVFRKKNGELFPVEISVEVVMDETGAPRHIQSVVRDISRRKKAEEALKSAHEQLRLRMSEVEQLQIELRELALHDSLTGLYNRHYLNETLPREFIRLAREDAPLSIIMADIDHFKAVNDNLGHLAGDQALVGISALFKQCTRGSDIICRYGGEEFLLAMPGADLTLAARRAEEIRMECANSSNLYPGQTQPLTLSFGVADYPAHGATADQVILHADKALYLAKNRGRNRVVVWEESAAVSHERE